MLVFLCFAAVIVTVLMIGAVSCLKQIRDVLYKNAGIEKKPKPLRPKDDF